MKDQYFGNRHDYIKHALLRRLTRDNGVRTAVCWMLTPPVEHDSGGLTSYLREPGARSYRPMDVELFEFLREAVCIREERAVSVIEESGLLHDTSFYRDRLTDSASHRMKYFKEFLGLAQGCELGFFDPDYGLEPTNVRYGQERSSKYLCRYEVAVTFNEGHSLLVYQQRPRYTPMMVIVERLANSLFELAEDAVQVYVFRSGQAAFALVVHPNHATAFTKPVAEIEQEHWPGNMQTVTYSYLPSRRRGWQGGLIMSGRHTDAL